MPKVFISGATGYMGQSLIPLLRERGHEVIALVRLGSEKKLRGACAFVVGDALDENTFVHLVAGTDSFIHLVGVPHPSPQKADQFRAVDLPSLRASVEAAVRAGVPYFVYISVAHPAPVMKAYVEVRSECEAIIQRSGLNATILRPWYVLGPGHSWPYALLPFYWVLEQLPPTREGALRLGLVTLSQMTHAIVHAVEHPSRGVRVMEVPEIREAGRNSM